MGLELVTQAAKGLKDNIDHFVAEIDSEEVSPTTYLLGEYSQRLQSFKRQELLEHANTDQINAVCGMTLNL